MSIHEMTVEILCDCAECKRKSDSDLGRLSDTFSGSDWYDVCEQAKEAGWKVPENHDEYGTWVHPDHARISCPHWAHEEEQEGCEDYERSHNRTCAHLIRPHGSRDDDRCGKSYEDDEEAI